MSTDLEEKLREAACNGDVDAVLALLGQNVNVNAKNSVNGWTALHWASKRGNEEIARLLLNNGADPTVENTNSLTPCDVCSNPAIANLLGEMHGDYPPTNNHSKDNGVLKFTPSYLRNPPLNGLADGMPRIVTRHKDFSVMPATALPSAANDELVLKVRVASSSDPDFIEIEIPRWKLTYSSLMRICCEELEIRENQVERIRKLPDTRLRKDSDVKRLTQLQGLEIVLKAPSSSENYKNCYQSISTCKDQTILY